MSDPNYWPVKPTRSSNWCRDHRCWLALDPVSGCGCISVTVFYRVARLMEAGEQNGINKVHGSYHFDLSSFGLSGTLVKKEWHILRDF